MMKYTIKTISRDKVFYFSLYSCLTVLLYLSVGLVDETQLNLNLLNSFALFQLTFSLIILIKFGYPMYSLPVIFIVLSYLFHLGQLPLLAYDLDIEMPWPVIELIDFDIYVKSVIYVLRVHSVLVLGILLNTRKTDPIIKIEDQQSEELELNRIFVIGKIFVIIGSFPLFYYEVKKFIAYITIGYGNTGIEPAGVVSLIMNLFYVGLILMLIGKKKCYKFSRNLLIYTLLIFVLMMISGSRGEKIVRIIIMFSIFFSISYTKQISLRSWIKYLTLAYFGLSFVNHISDMRSSSFSGSSSSFASFTTSLHNNPLLDAMGEFGGTFISVGYSLTFFPSYADFLLGASYLKGLSMAMLNIGGFIDNFRNEILYVFQFPVRYRYALGGSYIGELYANFGQFGILISFFIGIMIANFSNKLNNYSTSRQWIRYSIIIVIYSRMIWWIRDYFGNMIREVIWISILILLLNGILIKRQKQV